MDVRLVCNVLFRRVSCNASRSLEAWGESLLFCYGLFDEPMICHAFACSGLKYMEEEQTKKGLFGSRISLSILLCHIMP